MKLKTADEVCKTIEGESSSTMIKCILPEKVDLTTDEIVVIDGEDMHECTDPQLCTITWKDATTPVFSSYEGLNTIALVNDDTLFSFLGATLNETAVNYVFMVVNG